MSATAAFDLRELEAQLATAARELEGSDFNFDLEHEVQTDKARVKLVSCRECGRALVVSTFYVPANARCATCKGESAPGSAHPASVAVPRPGQTDPALAINLADCLLNEHFAFARCPVHPDDEAHAMELKSVNHSDNYGPSDLVGYDRSTGRPQYRQRAQGETVLHQCLACKATVTYSTTAQMQFARQNEVAATHGKGVNEMAVFLGVREEARSEVLHVDRQPLCGRWLEDIPTAVCQCGHPRSEHASFNRPAHAA